jgi:hypothetical protein
VNKQKTFFVFCSPFFGFRNKRRKKEGGREEGKEGRKDGRRETGREEKPKLMNILRANSEGC